MRGTTRVLIHACHDAKEQDIRHGLLVGTPDPGTGQFGGAIICRAEV
jgi:hypothetical protein